MLLITQVVALLTFNRAPDSTTENDFNSTINSTGNSTVNSIIQALFKILYMAFSFLYHIYSMQNVQQLNKQIIWVDVHNLFTINWIRVPRVAA